MDKNFLEVLCKNILNEIKNKIRKNKVLLVENKELETDAKMLKIIESVVENDEKFINKDEFEKNNKILNFNIMRSLIQYYMAIYNDNLDLLHKLLDNHFEWNCSENFIMNLFVLDKRISSKFSEDEYLQILKGNEAVFREFYSSLYRNKDNEDINDEEIISKFCNVIKKNNNIANTKTGVIRRKKNLLSADILKLFSEEEILNFNDEQKHILAFERSFIVMDNGKEFMLSLIKNYNYSKNLIYWKEFSKYFTEEEILNLTDSDINLYMEIFNTYDSFKNYDTIVSSAINKIKCIKKINPEFDYCLSAIVYDVLTIEEIMSLSKEGVDIIMNGCNIRRFNSNINEKVLRKYIKMVKCKDSVKTKVKSLFRK